MTNYMVDSDFHINGDSSSASAHEVYANVTYGKDKNKTYFYKKNKHQGDGEASIMEVAFSNLAELFLRKGLTPKQYVVKDDNKAVTGVASLSMVNVIANNEKSAQFKKLTHDKKKNSYILSNSQELQKPAIHFLEDFKQGHFAHLMQQHKKNNNVSFKIDMDSLASCLTTSYFLEEDDLHKGNMGYYIKSDNKESTAIFFKIDHDLMLSDSIMSHSDARVANWMYDEKSFNISVRDLENFPDLKDSGNHYWPTKKQLLVPLSHQKTYGSQAERKAFRNLKDNEEFKSAKWKYFFMQAVIPINKIEESLKRSLDQENEADLSRINLIKRSVYERQQKLLATLFASQKFRSQFSNEETRKTWMEAIKNIIGNDSFMALEKEINSLVVKAGNIDDEDTPLHVAIRLNKYRFSESSRVFKQYLNKKNSKKETPLDTVLKALGTRKAPSNVCAYNKSVARHLLKNGAKANSCHGILKRKTDDLKSHRFTHNFKNNSGHYLGDLDKIKTYDTLKAKLEKLDGDITIPLRQKKQISIKMIENFTKNPQKNRIELAKFQKALNNKETPCLKFIRQQRSKLWIVRVFKKLYGKTNTHEVMQSLVNKAQRKSQPNRVTHRFFGTEKSNQQNQQTTYTIKRL